MNVSIALAYGGLGLAALAAVWRLLIGPSLADRIIALDLGLIALMAAIAIDGAHRGDSTWLNLLIVIAIIGFTATVATTRFIEHGELRRGDDVAPADVDPIDGGARWSVAAQAFIVAGVLIIVMAGVGLVKFSTPYARIHAAGKASPVAFLVIAIGVSIELGWVGAARLAVAASALILTLPMAVHLLFRAIHRTDPDVDPGLDELRSSD